MKIDSRVEVMLASRTQILRAIHAIYSREEGAGAVKEKSREQLLKELETPASKIPKEKLLEALVPLLIAKGVISEEELVRKVRELER